MATIEASQRESLERAVTAWRFEQLRLAGFGERHALELAMRGDIDLHVAVRLIDRGCDCKTALRILR